MTSAIAQDMDLDVKVAAGAIKQEESSAQQPPPALEMNMDVLRFRPGKAYSRMNTGFTQQQAVVRSDLDRLHDMETFWIEMAKYNERTKNTPRELPRPEAARVGPLDAPDDDANTAANSAADDVPTTASRHERRAAGPAFTFASLFGFLQLCTQQHSAAVGEIIERFLERLIRRSLFDGVCDVILDACGSVFGLH